ncbi:MAG: hypothetical protein H6Q82_499 [Deltaproteobacteria bacterium]|nr:hypothetical protein [Deltaproteobacteria bacterium]
MKTPDGRLRTRTYLLLVVLISAGLAAGGILTGSKMVLWAMNLFGSGAADVPGSGSTTWLLISLGLGLVVVGMRCRKKIFPRHVGAGDCQRPHRILHGFPRRDDLRGKVHVAGRGVIPFRGHATLQPRLDDGDKERTSKEEESAMRTADRTFRKVTHLLLALMISAALAACGGGGGTTSPGTSGPATVSVSIASAPSFPAGTTFAPSTATLSPTTAAPPEDSPNFDNVWVTVTKLALIPSAGTEFPDVDGELEMENSSAGEGKLVTGTLAPPIRINLLDLSKDNVATLLNQFHGVPAGEYSKIRVYYENVVGQEVGQPDKEFHPTAHYHFDVHFVGGNLLIPVTSDPGGGIRFYQVEINLVGLKYHQAGKSDNILLRPQVFAELVGDPKYIVTGEAAEVFHPDRTFVVRTMNDNVDATYDSGTDWFYVDGRYVGPFGISAAAALRNTALVDVIGTFQSGVLVAEFVYITFPDATEGIADNVWIPPDNVAFVVREEAGDNVVVFPVPTRADAYYDNAVTNGQLTDADIENDVAVKARGYLVGAAIEAYWITVGP